MDWNVKLRKPFQHNFVHSRARFPAFVAGWGTGKTMCGILKGMILSERYPDNLGLIVRKNFTDLRDSTMADFTLNTGIKVPSNKDVVLPNGSKIMFRHMDELAGIIQNINLGWFFIEQAEEFDSDKEFDKLDGRLRRQGCFRQGFIIANTNGHNWIWRRWKSGDWCQVDISNNPDWETGIPGVKYSTLGSLDEATSFDNACILPKDTVASWRLKEKYAPATYRRYVLNSWEEVDTTDKVFPYSWLMRAVNKELLDFEMPRRIVACDPAEFGDDHTVIYGLENAKIIATEITAKKEPMDTAGRILRMSRDISATLVGVDADGIGSGICSRLSELGVNVLRIKSGEKAEDAEGHRDLKAEMWMNAQQMFRDNIVSLPDDEKLIEDLAAHTYTFNSKGQVRIEQKKEVKKRLGRSPDQGDAFVIGLWTLSKAPTASDNFYEETEENIQKSYSVKSVFM